MKGECIPVVEKKRINESGSPKPAARKPRVKKAPAAADPAVPPAEPGIGAQTAETVLAADAADPQTSPQLKAGAKKAAPRAEKSPAAAAADTAADSAADSAGSNLSNAEREALKAELQNEIAQLRGMLKRAANGFINPWKMPW